MLLYCLRWFYPSEPSQSTYLFPACLASFWKWSEVSGTSQGHKAVAECEDHLAKQGRRVVVITQNIDELHARAGSKNIIELHGMFEHVLLCAWLCKGCGAVHHILAFSGNLFKTRCTKCGHVEFNRDSPICESLRGKGWVEVDLQS